MARRLFLGALALVGLPVILVVAALGAANTDWGRAWIVDTVESATAGGPVRVGIDALGGSLPGRVVLEGVRLADAAGVFAELARVELDWSPLALLTGTVAVDAIAVDGGRVLRAPVLPEDPAAEPEPSEPLSLTFPEPPVAVRLDRLRVAGLRLGEALIGREATLTADLSASVTGAAATAAGWAELASAGGAARLDLDLAVVPGDGTLRAEVRVHEPEGGLMAELAGLPGRPALDLSLTGDGTLADWRGRLTGGFEAAAAVDLALVLAAEGPRTRLGVDGTADVVALLPEDLRAVVGPSAAIGVTLLRDDDGAVIVERATVRAAAVSVDGTARLDPSGTPVAMDARLDVPDLAPMAALVGSDLAGAVSARLRLLEDGRRAELSVTGDPRVASTVLERLAVDAAVSADRPLAALPETLTWSVEAGVDTPAPPGLDLAGLLGPRLALRSSGSVAGDGRTASVDSLAVTTGAGRLDATARLSEGRRIDATATLAVADLARLSDLAGRPLAGSATLGADATLLLDPFDVSAVIDLAADGLSLGDPALDRLTGGAPTLGAAVTLDADNRLSIHGLTLQAATLRADGDAMVDLTGGDLSGRVDVAAPDLAPVGRAVGTDVSGAGTVALALGGSLDAPTASASWRAAPLAVAGVRVAELSGSATATGLPARPTGRIALRAATGGEAVTLAAGYAFDDGVLTIEGLALDGAGVAGRGALTVDVAGPTVDGRMTVTASDLGRVGALAGVPLSGGSLDAEVTLQPRNGQSARLTLTGRDVAIDGGATVIASVDVTGTGRNLMARPAGSLRAEVGGVRQGDETVLASALVTGESDGSAARVAATLEGEAGMPYRVAAEASLALGAQPLRITLASLDAELADATIALDRPTLITLGSRPRVEDLALRVEGGRITGGGSLDPAALDLTLQARAVPAGLARLADPALSLTGGVDADATVRGPIGNPRARLTVTAAAIRSSDPAYADLPPLSASAEARIEDRQLTASLDATVGEGLQAGLRASAGLRAGADGAPPSLDPAAPLSAQLTLEAALERVSAYLPLDGGRVAGQASLRLAVAGTPEDPLIDGTVSLRDGAIDQPSIGLYLRDVRLEGRGRGDRLVIETLTASGASGGTLEGAGGISLDPAEGMPADLTLTARRLVAVDTDDAEVALDADLSFSGRLPDYRLAGTITVLPSEIRIPDQLPPSVVRLEVTEVRDGVVIRSPEAPAEEGTDGGAPITLDLRVDVPGQVFVRGRGLDSEWGGALTVTGPVTDPEVTGGLEVRRGQLAAVGRTFQFERGRVVFDGAPPDDPTLDMILTTEAGEVTAKVLIAGRAQDPSITLTSEPALPEEDVLSHILFGSSRAQLSPLQALKLAQSAAVLSGRMGSGGVTDTIRETLGVDTVDIDAGDGTGTGSRGASLSVGKYVAPGVFLKLQQGLGGSGSKAVVEVEITDSITVETDVGADSQSRVGVNWKLDY